MKELIRENELGISSGRTIGSRNAERVTSTYSARLGADSVHRIRRETGSREEHHSPATGWRVPDSVFVVLRDQDAADCLTVKRTLVRKCREAGKPDTIVRIACRELESWYFGDLVAVGKSLGLPSLVRYAKQKKYRVPDSIHSPGNELKNISRDAYQKLSGSRAIGSNLSPEVNRSHSFGVFIAGVRRAVAGEV